MKKINLCYLIGIIIILLLSTKAQARIPIASQYGIASWYSEFSPGINKYTANMETFDDQDLTCAIWDIPFNTLIKVTNLSNNKSVVVRVNDRGPNKRFSERIIDLSMGAFSKIENLDKGLVRVKIEILQ